MARECLCRTCEASNLVRVAVVGQEPGVSAGGVGGDATR